MKKFTSRLNYSLGNEDWRTEQKALQIAPYDRILCITASGDRPLHLLLQECDEVIAIDTNPIQNHLLHLKCAAIQSFDYHRCLAFLGYTPCDDRHNLFHDLVRNLNPDSATYWKKKISMIKAGILYQGKTERLTKLIANIFKVARPNKVRRLFEISTLAEQQQFIRNEWDTILFRKIFEIGLSKSVGRILKIDPGLFEFVDPSIGFGTYLYDRMIKCLNQRLAKESLLLSLIYRGFVGPEALPAYLQEKGFHTIKERIPRLTVKTGNVITYLESTPADTYDKFSLSDIASYMNQEAFHSLVKNIYRTAKPSARFCIRQLSSNHSIHDSFAINFHRDTALEKALEDEDNCFVYRFMVGKIAKNQKINNFERSVDSDINVKLLKELIPHKIENLV